MSRQRWPLTANGFHMYKLTSRQFGGIGTVRTLLLKPSPTSFPHGCLFWCPLFFRGFRQFRGSLSSSFSFLSILRLISRCPRIWNPRSASLCCHPARADRGRLVEQAVFLLLPGQPSEFGHERVPGWKERFLAVEDGGIGARCVVVAVELPRPERELDATKQGWVRVGVEFGIDQVRDLPRMPVQLDQGRPLDLAQVRPAQPS